MRTRLLRALRLGIILASATACVTVLLRSQGYGGRAAFTATQTYTVYSGAVVAKSFVRVMAERSDGSSAEQLQIPGEDGRSFFDATTKRVFRVDPRFKWASVRAAGNAEASRYLALKTDCMNAYGGRVVVATCVPVSEKVLGYDVVAVTRSIKADPSLEFHYLGSVMK